MVQYIIRRAIWLIPVFLMVSGLTFIMMHNTPGGPWDARPGKALTPAVRQLIAKKYGLDKPLVLQYTDYIWGALHGDLGPSYYGTRTVSQILSEGFPVTAELGLIALTIAILIGIPVGLLAALGHNGLFDHFVVFVITIAYSLPNFVIGIFLIAGVSVALKLADLFPPKFDFNDWKSWIFPAGILALTSVSAIVRLTRSAVLDVLGQDYVRTARAKGLSAAVVDFRHVLRNALIPVVTLIGPLTANLITGSFVVESMFAVPGIGRIFVQSVNKRDYALFMGVTLLYAFLVVFFNLLVDLTYSFLDPRIVRN